MISRHALSFSRRKHPVFVWLCLMTFMAVAVSCDDDDDDDSMQPTQTIVALAQMNDNLSSLEAALNRFPDLVTTLNSGSNQYTVFAPTNAAFQDLLEAIGQTSLDDIPDDVLRDVLEYHVIAGSAVMSTQLTSTDIETVAGEDVAISVTNGVRLNGNTQVTTADVEATNGVVHVVDAVLVPPSIAPVVGTIVAPAYFNRNFTTLIAAVKAASPAIMEALLSEDAGTLFAPTNDAFAAAGITTLPSREVLDAVLSYHVIPAEVMAADIAEGSSMAETLNGIIYLSNGSEGVFINGTSQVTSTDIAASNGIVHVIDRTLMPPNQTIAEIATSFASASSAPEFTQLVAALARTSGEGANDLLAAASNEAADLTVFAPTDAAFEELYTALGVDGVDDIPLETLIAVLKHHIVAARVFSTDLSSGMVGTLNGDVTVDLSNPPTVTGNSGTENKAALQTSMLDIHATNGVIHVIDMVLLP